jgi:hypothetical protein
VSVFHHRDGLYFERLADGSVRMFKRATANPADPLLFEHIIPASEWPSIVSSVSAGGELDGRYAAAQVLHESLGQVEVLKAARVFEVTYVDDEHNTAHATVHGTDGLHRFVLGHPEHIVDVVER